MRFKIIIINIILLWLFNGIYAQNTGYTDTVYLKDNIKIPCKILESGYEEITILYGDSSVTKIKTDNLVEYRFGDYKTFKQNKRADFRSFSNNTVFFEMLGNGYNYSINYDRILLRNNNSAITFRIGYTQAIKGCFLPIEFNLIGNNKVPGCYTEFGIGYTPLVWADEEMSSIFFRIGFRYQPDKGGLFLRAAFLPMYQFSHSYYDSYFFPGYNNNGIFLPYYGVSIGYTIQK